jgi:hypothetical protein
LLQYFIANSALEFVLSWAGAVLFCFFIIYDTQVLCLFLGSAVYMRVSHKVSSQCTCFGLFIFKYLNRKYRLPYTNSLLILLYIE